MPNNLRKKRQIIRGAAAVRQANLEQYAEALRSKYVVMKRRQLAKIITELGQKEGKDSKIKELLKKWRRAKQERLSPTEEAALRKDLVEYLIKHALRQVQF